jgi:branched-chain amino acid transport system substrate-binding protein
MNRKPHMGDKRITRRTVTAGLGASVVAGIAPMNIVRAQDATLKVGVLLPRSGAQAGIGQDCQRGVDITPGLLKDLGMPPLQIMNGDTETSVEVERRSSSAPSTPVRAPQSLRSPSKKASPTSSI